MLLRDGIELFASIYGDSWWYILVCDNILRYLVAFSDICLALIIAIVIIFIRIDVYEWVLFASLLLWS